MKKNYDRPRKGSYSIPHVELIKLLKLVGGRIVKSRTGILYLFIKEYHRVYYLPSKRAYKVYPGEREFTTVRKTRTYLENTQ